MARGGAPGKGWYRDPTGRHDLRRWDGDGWSEWVMDGTRRSFDDLDGVGGPPQGEPVPVDEGGPRVTRAARGRGGAFARARGGGGSADSLLPTPEGASRALVPAVAGAMCAGAAAFAIVTLGERDLLPSAGPGGSEDIVRRFLLPIVVATLVFLAVLAVTGRVVRGRGGAAARSPWRTVAGVGRDEILRGLVAFLLALFARTFLMSTFAAPYAGAVRPVGPWWLFVLEAIAVLTVAPVVEEVVFRGAIFTALRHRARPVIAVFGSALIYGAAHAYLGVGTSHLAMALGAFAVGAVFAWFTHSTDDLRPVIVGHIMLNGWFVAERLLAA